MFLVMFGSPDFLRLAAVCGGPCVDGTNGQEIVLLAGKLYCCRSQDESNGLSSSACNFQHFDGMVVGRHLLFFVTSFHSCRHCACNLCV